MKSPALNTMTELATAGKFPTEIVVALAAGTLASVNAAA
jgi:hypothetical protein